MLDIAGLKQIVHQTGLAQTTRLLLCLAVGDDPKSLGTIKEIGAKAGIKGIKNWNISQLLSGSGGKAIKTPTGWELSPSGILAIEPLAGPLLTTAAPKAATSLRSHLPGIGDSDARSFVEQAIGCYENKFYRAAVVLSWVGAVAVLYDYVVVNTLARFNAEAQLRAAARKQTWKDAKTRDDLALMGEHDFLQVLEKLSVIGKSVKTELEGCLKLRNGCGHPNSLQIAEHRVASHIEVLMLNVFAKF